MRKIKEEEERGHCTSAQIQKLKALQNSIKACSTFMSPDVPVALLPKMAVRQTISLGDVKKMTSWWDLWGNNRFRHPLITWDICPLAQPYRHIINTIIVHAEQLPCCISHLLIKTGLTCLKNKVYKLRFPYRKWSPSEKWIHIFQYHHPFWAQVTRKYLDRMYVISLGRNWLSWNPEKILPLGRKNQPCRNSQLEISFQIAG